VCSDNTSLFWECGNLQMDLKDFDAAMYDFNLIAVRDPNNTRACAAYERAFIARKNTTRFDLYAVLGVRKATT
jgi:hypothetical protein